MKFHWELSPAHSSSSPSRLCLSCYKWTLWRPQTVDFQLEPQCYPVLQASCYVCKHLKCKLLLKLCQDFKFFTSKILPTISRKNYANYLSHVCCLLFLDCVRQVDGGSKSRHWLICHRMCACRHSLVNDCQPWNQILPMFSVIHEILECQEARNCSFKSWILTLPSNLFLILSTSFRVKQIACVKSFKTILTTKRWPQAPVSETLQRCQSSKESRNLNSQVLSWL